MNTNRRQFLKAGLAVATAGPSLQTAGTGAQSKTASSRGRSAAAPFQLLLNTDPFIPLFFFPNKPSKGDLDYFIDRLATGSIDAYTYCIFEEGYTLIRNSKYGEPRYPDGAGGYPSPSCQEYNPIYAAGEDPVEIFAARCHQHGMKFLAGFRMNDRHPDPKGRFIEQHPEWQIRELSGKGMDFSFREVRQWMLGMMQEAAEQYDLDGLELDYMRWCHMFPPSVARERHPVLTEFMRQVRELLNGAGRSKKRKLLLGARVPQRLKDAQALGYDIPAWVEGKLVDYLCPSDFMYTDFNAPYEDFTRLARAAGCRIYPSIHPVICDGLDGALLTPAQYRAAAQTFYAAGADGISLYNFQYHWQQRARLHYPGVPSNYADILHFVKQLRDRRAIAGGTRHYLFYPLWQNKPPTGVDGVEGVHKMTLMERSEINQRKVFAFRLGEPSGPGHRRWQFLFNAVGMTDKDEIAVDINGTAVEPAEIQRLYNPNGLKVEHRRPLGPYSSVRFFLANLPLKQGVNELGVRLLRSDPAASGRIEVQEVEVIVDPV